jgi:tRNA uridine 5-carbamoylmethylation protein Kti12
MTTYLEVLQKIQNQTLDNIKQLQAVQIATFRTARELIVALPTAKGVPTLSEVTELSSSFVNKVLDQQKVFVDELADVIKPEVEPKSLVKASSN